MSKFTSKAINAVQLLPYLNLKLGPRYKQKKTKVLGKAFKVADGMSFYYSYKEIFLKEIYKFNTQNSSPVIIDCGSNYGTSILYFKELYPKAKVTGVEADPKIFELLKWNIDQHGYETVNLINKAVSTSPEPISFWSEGADSGRILAGKEQKEAQMIQTVSLDDLITEPVDFLKIDIEGAETDVICGTSKLDMVDQLFIEYHSFKETPQGLNELLSKLTTSNFRYYILTQFCSEKPLTEEALYLGMDLQLNIFGKRIKK